MANQDTSSYREQAELPAIGARLLGLRKKNKLTLEELSSLAGVSKSMLSQIERNEANPTVAVLWRLTNALNVALSDFLSVDEDAMPERLIALVSAHATPVIRSPDGLCVLRILGPTELIGRIEWYELTVDPAGRLQSHAHQSGSQEHLSLLDGTLCIEVGDDVKTIHEGETARYACDREHAIINDTQQCARAILVVQY